MAVASSAASSASSMASMVIRMSMLQIRRRPRSASIVFPSSPGRVFGTEPICDARTRATFEPRLASSRPRRSLSRRGAPASPLRLVRLFEHARFGETRWIGTAFSQGGKGGVAGRRRVSIALGTAASSAGLVVARLRECRTVA